jgi:hypothetical protein
MSFVGRRRGSLFLSDRKGGAALDEPHNILLLPLNALSGTWSWSLCALTVKPLRSSKMIVPLRCGRSAQRVSLFLSRQDTLHQPARHNSIPVPAMQGAPTIQHVFHDNGRGSVSGLTQSYCALPTYAVLRSEAQSMLCRQGPLSLAKPWPSSRQCLYHGVLETWRKFQVEIWSLFQRFLVDSLVSAYEAGGLLPD